MAKALRLSYENMDEDLKQIKELNNHLKNELSKYEKVTINSNKHSIDQIVNFSVLGVKPETFMHSLEEDNVYISTQSACSTGNYSKAVLAITNDMEKASSSLRVSISRKTTKEEIDLFLKAFDKSYKKLVN